jgi:hypothetical protein
MFFRAHVLGLSQLDGHTGSAVNIHIEEIVPSPLSYIISDLRLNMVRDLKD